MIEIGEVSIPSHVSYSAITTYLKCGYMYFLSRLKGIEEESSVWLVGGSSFHRATEEWDKAQYE